MLLVLSLIIGGAIEEYGVDPLCCVDMLNLTASVSHDYTARGRGSFIQFDFDFMM